MTVLLLVGLLAVFAGIVVTLLVVNASSAERSALARTLATIEASGPLPDSMREEIDPPFQHRVLAPLRARAISVGHALTPADWSGRIRHKLDLAGNPVGWDPERILAAKVAWTLVLGGGTAVLSLLLDWGLKGLLVAAGLAALGFFGPDIWLKQVADKRTQDMRRALPDSLDMLTISVESGLAFDAAMQQVAEKTDGPLAGEFQRTLQEIQLGTSRADALRALAQRSNVEDLNYIVTALVQADRLGIPIAEVLRVQAGEMRLKRTQAAEEKAAKLPVKILIPLLICIMPAMFVLILGPAGIRIASMFANM